MGKGVVIGPEGISGKCESCGKESMALRRFPQSDQSLCPACWAEMQEILELPEEERH